MSAMEYLGNLVSAATLKLSKEELLLLEAGLFACICENLQEFYRNHLKDYFQLMKFTMEMENNMLETNLARFLIEDILSTEEYTLQGIAYYADVPEDIIREVATGRNTSPTAKVLRRVIELHRTVRRDLYQSIISKIASEYQVAA